MITAYCFYSGLFICKAILLQMQQCCKNIFLCFDCGIQKPLYICLIKPNTMKQINNTDAAVLATMFIMAVVTICIIL